MRYNVIRNRALVTALIAIALLAGCGKNTAPAGQNIKDNGVETETPDGVDDNQNEETQIEVKENGSEASRLKDLVGEYELLAIFSEEYTNILSDDEASGSMSIYVEDDRYKADYMYELYENSAECYGTELIQGSEDYFNDFVKSDWNYIMKRNNLNSVCSVTSTEAGTVTMQMCRTYEYENEDGETVTEVENRYFLFVSEGNKNREQIEHDLLYPETITVSNVQELCKGIGNGKHIILKGGTYNISGLSEEDIEANPLVNNQDYGEEGWYIWGETMMLYNLSNIILEGEEGAEVLICTEDPSVAPLDFRTCSNITLKNLTLGHEVEPGLCSGSVVSVNGCDNVTIEKCSLYGSGTYGIDAYVTYNLFVNDTDIYECTNGGVDISRCSNVVFNRCKIRDSEEYDILAITNCVDVHFNQCEITNNYSGGYWALIDTSDSQEVYFNECVIKDNEYTKFNVGNPVVFEKCEIQKEAVD